MFLLYSVVIKLMGQRKGYKMSDEHKKNLGISKLGSKNPMWKEHIQYESLHQWVRDNLPKPELCEDCRLKPPYDLANITGMYNRDFINWMYLCRKCHMLSDGRMKNLIPRGVGWKHSPETIRKIIDSNKKTWRLKHA